MKSGQWLRQAAVVGTIAMLLSGCSLLGIGDSSSSSKDIDPPPVGSIEDVIANTTEDHIPTISSSITDKVDARTIYAKDSHGLVVPVTLNLPQTQAPAQKVLEYMVDGGPVSAMLPKGFTSILPSGTKVKGMTINENKLAVVDFSKELLNYKQEDERKMLEGITWALTTFGNIDHVQLRVEGNDLTELPKNGMPIDEPVSRSIGINVEKLPDVNYGQSTAVTLYFMSGTADYPYYVPVTRHIKRTDQVAEAVMEQLIKGPVSPHLLSSAINPVTNVVQLSPTDHLITVNLTGIEDQDHKVSSEALKSIVLSLTENTTATAVQIMIDGDAKFTTTDKSNYSKPVVKPTNLNPVKM